MASLRQRLFKKKGSSSSTSDADRKALVETTATDDWEDIGMDTPVESGEEEEAGLKTCRSKDDTRDHSPAQSSVASADLIDVDPVKQTDTPPVEEEKSMYELQLTQLQEQLVSAMIENQNLKSELSLCGERGKFEQMMRSLESEREKVRLLEEQVSILRAENRSSRSPSRSRSVSSVVDEAKEATEDAVTDETSKKLPPTLYSKFSAKFTEWFFDLLEDFTGDPDPEPKAISDESLSVKRLKENITRFKSGAEPIFHMAKVIHSVFTWKSPLITAVCFMIYMGAAYQDWLIPMFLSLFITQLLVNYMKHKGWNISFNIFGNITEDPKDGENFRELKVTEKFDVVIQVATKVQNTLGFLADNLEKLKNLLMWKQPESTSYLLRMLTLAFILSCLMNGVTLFKCISLYAGIKFFVINFLYDRFPRLQQKHDTVLRIWKNLPTDSQYEVTKRKAVITQYIEPNIVRFNKQEDDGIVSIQTISESTHKFCDTFDLPITEKPLPAWASGRRCTYILKEKTLASAFTHGRLYLTNSFLCFEASKKNSSKNIIIPLVEIKHMNKAKPYSWMPGSGMAVEIAVMKQEKPYLFGGMLNRDECYDAIRSQRMQRKVRSMPSQSTTEQV